MTRLQYSYCNTALSSIWCFAERTNWLKKTLKVRFIDERFRLCKCVVAIQAKSLMSIGKGKRVIMMMIATIIWITVNRQLWWHFLSIREMLHWSVNNSYIRTKSKNIWWGLVPFVNGLQVAGYPLSLKLNKVEGKTLNFSLLTSSLFKCSSSSSLHRRAF